MNKKINHSLIFTAILIGFLGITPPAIADVDPAGHQAPAFAYLVVHTFDNRIALIELSEEEAIRLEEDLDAFGEAIFALKKEICLNSRELMQVISESDPDIDAAKTLQAAISRLNAELDLLRIEHIIQMKKILPDLSPDASPAEERSAPPNRKNGHVYNS